jgi:hypothetical protein
MKTQFAPIAQQIINDKFYLTNIWMTWLRTLSTVMVDSGKIVKVNDKFSYNLNNSIFTINFIGQSDAYIINIPGQIAENSIMSYWILEDGVWINRIIDVNKNDTTISLPTGNLKINHALLLK